MKHHFVSVDDTGRVGRPLPPQDLSPHRPTRAGTLAQTFGKSCDMQDRAPSIRDLSVIPNWIVRAANRAISKRGAGVAPQLL
jgi:hypothetical protein